MEYFYDTIADKLVTSIRQERKEWVRLPQEYQDKFFEDITAVRFGEKILISHHQLKPAMWCSNNWNEIQVKEGTRIEEQNGLLSFHEPQPSPAEQRDAFQRNYPHLVKDCSEPLPKVIRDQLDVSPLHYRKGEIQPWDFITSQGMGFLEGNVVKYIARYKHKHKNGLEDLKKARTYLDKLILEVEKCAD